MNNDLKKVVGKELMLLRKEKDLSNAELANKTKIAPSTISRYEKGNDAMNLDIIAKMINGCDFDISIFFERCIAKMQQNNQTFKEVTK
ncbi:MAG TPA: helix-turn-helix transcriptional regulator [Candidatus Coprosoma intestinipullorum]|uniref:Helix-turn-helix transcriptional regulator n=1 Tax=Candidatus Coprosoma intestinipullorum TaxID=2840752 RepID=A0A9D0ZTE9_9FIRM|nr:helix-turn-helix transcriptional regulator [Candidatus Coprosoma intestinipullorum]